MTGQEKLLIQFLTLIYEGRIKRRDCAGLLCGAYSMNGLGLVWYGLTVVRMGHAGISASQRKMKTDVNSHVMHVPRIPVCMFMC